MWTLLNGRVLGSSRSSGERVDFIQGFENSVNRAQFNSVCFFPPQCICLAQMVSPC